MNLLNMVLSIGILAGYCIAASGAKNFNSSVAVYLVITAACCGVYFFVEHIVVDIANLLAVIFITLAIGTFATNSINTFADVLNGISMFGSSGGIEYIIVLLSLMAIALIIEIVSCFMSRETKLGINSIEKIEE